MTRYGVPLYGEALYGAPQLSVFSAAPVTAAPYTYGEVLVSWHTPGGVWDELRVIRNYLGYPVAVDNGVEVFSTTPTGGGASVRDRGLKQDHWAYYTVFVHSTADTGEWVRAGVAKCYVPINYGGADRMYSLIPEIAQSDTLAKFMSVLGYAYDLLRNDINSLLDLYDAMTVNYDLLPVILAQFGVPIETELEPEQYRRFLRNAAFFYKTKGTMPCVHGVVAAVTGWQCMVFTGPNMMWSADYSDFTGGIGGWIPKVNSSVAWVPPAGSASGALQMTATAAASTAEAHISELLPALPSETYSIAALVQAMDVVENAAGIRLDWYDVTNTFISSTETADVTARQAGSAQIRGTVTSPANAAWVDVVAVVHSPVAGKRWQWRQVMVNEGSQVPYSPGRDIQIFLLITDTDPVRQAVHLNRLNDVLPRYLPLGATYSLLVGGEEGMTPPAYYVGGDDNIVVPT